MRRLPGTHPANIKNRSSKNIGFLCGVGHKPIMRCLNNEMLRKMANEGNRDASKEVMRRQKKNDKKVVK